MDDLQRRLIEQEDMEMRHVVVSGSFSKDPSTTIRITDSQESCAAALRFSSALAAYHYLSSL